ncbi:signal peptidase I [Aeromicrobium marinum DSM 15272]|uniref:Signal peptidase I n=1 Tax=Aeromicrobium marinum DSM 15272 TaxID=585531 RepID=E2S9D8_9ACTN|nr:signal peptidase I [Aeromicrobium marinum]EFQ83862.1 signal peptidase I [Aeromicrobium marinum DSM 15272]
MTQHRAPASSRTSRLRRAGRETALTAGAVLGVLCLTIALAGMAFDVRPVIFRSGSMEPEIQTGALALSRTTDASELVVGDVVTVRDARGVLVTHRIVSLTTSGSEATLVLQGDANPVPDADPYVVQSADRILFDVPRLGYVVSALSGPAGIFGGGLLVGLLLTTVFARRRDDDHTPGPGAGPGPTDAVEPTEADDTPADEPGRSGGRAARRGKGRMTLAAMVAVVAAVGVGSTTSTTAAWVDNAAVTTGTFSMQQAPVQVLTCTVVPIGGGFGIRLDWVSAQNPLLGWTVSANNLGNSLALGLPDALLGNARQWTSPQFNNRSGVVTVTRTLGTELGSVSFDFGPGNGIGNKSCTVNP